VTSLKALKMFISEMLMQKIPILVRFAEVSEEFYHLLQICEFPAEILTSAKMDSGKVMQNIYSELKEKYS